MNRRELATTIVLLVPSVVMLAGLVYLNAQNNERNQRLIDELQKERIVFEAEYFAPELNIGARPPDIQIDGISTSTITQRVFVENVGRSQATNVTLSIRFGIDFRYSPDSGVFIPADALEGTMGIRFHPDTVKVVMDPPYHNIVPV